MDLIKKDNFYLISALAAFYLIVFSTYLSFLFTCNIDNAIKNNQTLIIIMGYFLFFYLVTLSDKFNVDNHPIQNMLITLLYYIVFLFTTRMDIKITCIVVLIIFIINFLDINKEHYKILLKNQKSKKDDKTYLISLNKPFKIDLIPINEEQLIYIDNVELALNYSLYILIAIGFLSFFGEMKYMKGDKNISLYKLFFDRNICHIRDKRSTLDNILHAFNIK